MEENDLFHAICHFDIQIEEVKYLHEINPTHFETISENEFRSNGEKNKETVDEPINLETSACLNEIYWLSWVVWDQTYQSPEFTFGNLNPKFQNSQLIGSRDSISFKYFFRPEKMFSYLPKELISIFPLTFYLCSKDGVKGTLLCDPFNLQDHFKENLEAVKLTFPLSFEKWLSLNAVASTNGSKESNFIKSLVVRIKMDIQTDFKLNAQPAEKPPSQLTKEVVFVESPLEEVKLESENDEQDENSLRHFRVHINLYSLKGLNNPAYLTLQFTYPHFGIANVIKTPPQYFSMKNEVKIEKGIVSYECMTTRSRLKEILFKYPLKIEFLRKSHLGNESMADGVLPLFEVDSSGPSLQFPPPHSFRCPITNQTFTALLDYQKHYERLLVLYKQNEINVLPSKEPEVIYANDQLMDLRETSHDQSEGGRIFSTSSKLRVITIIEDKGRVGKEVALKVSPGFKMQNGGVYKMNQESSNLLNPWPVSSTQQQSDITPLSNNYNELHRVQRFTPSISMDVNDYENHNAFIDHLLMDWELFRQKQENEWKKSLYEKEMQLRKEIETEYASKFYQIMDDMKRSKQEVSKLEVRLKNSLELVEKEKNFLANQKESLNNSYKQKFQELIIYAKKCKSQAELDLEKMKNEKAILENNQKLLQQQNFLLEKKFSQLQENYDTLYNKYKYSSEMKLKEEIILMKTEIQNLQEKVNQEIKMKENLILEREYYRSQMYKLATCLKREREKNNIMIKQELEHLRLEFLAREERYLLDGDRETLNYIRRELANLNFSHYYSNQEAFNPPDGHSSRTELSEVVPNSTKTGDEQKGIAEGEIKTSFYSDTY